MSATPSSKYHFQDTDATREGLLLRLALCGPAGAGKSKTALELATRIAIRFGFNPAKDIFGADSESNNLLKYAFSPNRQTGYRFRHVPMPVDDHSIEAYTAVLDYCEGKGAKIIIIDSLSHAWAGLGGVLECVDRITENATSKNAFSTGWKKMSPQQTRFMQRLLESPAHVIFTLRAKMEYVIEKNNNGKTEPQKVGLGPVQRDGIEYEPDLFFDLQQVPIESDVAAAKTQKRKPRTEVRLTVSKTRCDLLPPGDVFMNPAEELADLIADWLMDAPPPANPRTVGEALAIALKKALEGQSAPEAEQRKAAYDTAISEFHDHCVRFGVSKERMPTLGEHFRTRFKEERGARAATEASGKSDSPPAGGAAAA